MRDAAKTAMAPFAVFDLLGTPAFGAWTGVLRMAEVVRPVRGSSAPKRSRWWLNVRLGSSAAVVERALVVPALVAAARSAERRDWGLLRLLPRGLLRGAAGLLALDLGMYVWHRASHESEFFWRFHRVHHTDPGLDLTTAARLHPGELLLSVLTRGAQVVLLGPSARVVLCYELAMQCAALFHHANVDLGPRGDAHLARLFMTPRLHGRHHSATAEERASNWGIVLSVWDRLFDTFEQAPAQDPRLGLEGERAGTRAGVRALLALPFVGWRTFG